VVDVDVFDCEWWEYWVVGVGVDGVGVE